MQTPLTQRIGIFGGTFNPIHTGHLILAATAQELFELSQVIFIPCACPPHKDGAPVVNPRHRMAMVEAAIEDSLGFETSDIEIERGGRSFAIDTVRQLCRQYPDARLFFIVGSDSLKELHLWKDIYSLLPLCEFITFSRPGHDVDDIGTHDLALEGPWPERLLRNVRRSRHIEISSSEIRGRLAEGLSIRYLVPASVEMYISEHSLYGSGA